MRNSDHASQFRTSQAFPGKKHPLPRSGCPRRDNQVSLRRPFQQIVRQNPVQLFAIQERESRPKTGNAWASFEKAMPEEQVSHPELYNKAKRLYLTVRDRLDGTASSDQFHAGN